MRTTLIPAFDDPLAGEMLADLSPVDLDSLDYGVIGFDGLTFVRRYNAFEANAAGLRPTRVIGQPLFDVVAPCMNNFLVAHRFEQARADRVVLDEVIPYVLTLRMQPTRIHLRLVALPDALLRYVLIQRRV